jgi:ribosomal-protein-alanine N-acetyltransferase
MADFALKTDGIRAPARVGERLEDDRGHADERGDEHATVEGITALIVRAMPHPWSAGQVRDALASERSSLIWQEDDAGDLVGCVVGRRVARNLVEIDLVAVDPECRREGRGRLLLEELMAAERAGGVDEFRLELAFGNGPALALYEAVGFVVVGRRARYYPDGADALLLTWTAPSAAGGAGDDQGRGD